MKFPPLALPTTLSAIGFFILTQGIDSLKVEHLGVRLLTVEWFARVTKVSYHAAGMICIVVAATLMFSGSAICRHNDKRVVAAIPGLADPKSFRFVIPLAVFFGFTGW